MVIIIKHLWGTDVVNVDEREKTKYCFSFILLIIKMNNETVSFMENGSGEH